MCSTFRIALKAHNNTISFCVRLRWLSVEYLVPPVALIYDARERERGYSTHVWVRRGVPKAIAPTPKTRRESGGGKECGNANNIDTERDFDCR